MEDIDVAENRIHLRDRGELSNGAEIKTVHAPRSIDVSSDLIDEIVTYVGRAHTAEVETNHLFIKLHGQRSGQALTYADVDSLFRRLRHKTGCDVTPHVLRHTMLTQLAELGWALSADLSNLCASLTRGPSSGMGTGTGSSLSRHSL